MFTTIELPVVGEDESERPELIPNTCNLCNPCLNGIESPPCSEGRDRGKLPETGLTSQFSKDTLG